ncbi:MAG: energy transducer TonB [Panacagrimonas sp.]
MNFAAEGGGTTANNRVIGLAVVIGLHVVLVWGLMNGLARKAIELLPAPIETRIIEDIKPPAEEPPPPKPDFKLPPPPFIPPPDIVITAPVEPSAAITQTTPVEPVAAPEPIAPKAVVRTSPKIDLKGSPRACREPEYPAASERLGESGTSGISLLIGVEGKVEQSRIDASSGFVRLDEAAVKAFTRCKFSVGTRDGVPEPSWFSIRYKWVVPQ